MVECLQALQTKLKVHLKSHPVMPRVRANEKGRRSKSLISPVSPTHRHHAPTMRAMPLRPQCDGISNPSGLTESRRRSCKDLRLGTVTPSVSRKGYRPHRETGCHLI